MNEVLHLINEMSPYLLLGFFFAGLMHAFIPRSIYKRFLSGQNLRSVINAALLGIPLPLCSCGVLPTAMSLRKEGASHGAVVSFLIATPQTGVDSIIATYSLMGLPFAIIRPIAALVTAVFGGALVNSKPTSLPHPASEESSHNCCHEQKEDGCCCHADTNPSMSFFEKMKGDVLGVWLACDLNAKHNFSTVLQRNDFLATFVASTLRSVRFGAEDPTGLANVAIWNWLVKQGAVVRNNETGVYAIHFDQTFQAVTDLASFILKTQATGDADAARQFAADYGKMTTALKADVRKMHLEELPVDIRFK